MISVQMVSTRNKFGPFWYDVTYFKCQLGNTQLKLISVSFSFPFISFKLLNQHELNWILMCKDTQAHALDYNAWESYLLCRLFSVKRYFRKIIDWHLLLYPHEYQLLFIAAFKEFSIKSSLWSQIVAIKHCIYRLSRKWLRNVLFLVINHFSSIFSVSTC